MSEYDSENYIKFIEMNRRDKLSSFGLMLIADKYRDFEKETKELKEAMRWFCNRVDAGEVKSKRTYERFKELLDKYE